MSPAKESILDIIGRQPDDSTYDEILRELAFARMVQRGLDDAAAGRTHTAEEVAEAIESWRKQGGLSRRCDASKRFTGYRNRQSPGCF